MKRLAIKAENCIPNTIQDAIAYQTAHQFKASVQKYGSVFAFEQLRTLGSKAAVGFLVDLLAPGIVSAQGYVRLAFALKMGSRVSHAVLERLTTATHVETVQKRVRPFTDCQLEADGSQALVQVTVDETRHVAKYFYWWQLCVVARQQHEIALERELCEYVQERSLAHKAFVNAKGTH